MARPRRRTQGLLSSLAGKGAGKGRRQKSRSQCGMCRRQQGMAGSAWVRRGSSKEKRKTGGRCLLSAMQRRIKTTVGGTGRRRGRSCPLYQRTAKDGGGCDGRTFFQQENPVGRHAEKAGRARHTGRHGPDEKAFPFLRKKNSRPKAGRQASGRRPGCRAGRQGLEEKVLERRGGPTEGGRRPCPLRRGSYGQRQEGSNAAEAACRLLSYPS